MEKKQNAMKKVGKTIKDTFMEMSQSLAGWIDDASTHLSKQYRRSTQSTTNNAASKTTASKSTTQQKSQQPKKEIPQPEKC